MDSFPETYNHLRRRECMKFCIPRTYITVCNRDVFVFKSNLLYTYRANLISCIKEVAMYQKVRDL